MKKILLLAAMILAAGALFTGCGNPLNSGSTADDSSSSSGSGDSSTGEDSSKELYTITFDETKIKVIDYWTSEEIKSGGSFSSGVRLSYIGYVDGKIVEWSVNNGEKTYKGEELSLDSFALYELSGKALTVTAAMRDPYSGVLDFDENKIAAKAVGLVEKEYKSGDTVTEDESIRFSAICRGEFADSYSLNGEETAISSDRQPSVKIDVTKDTIKDGKISLVFNTHTAKTALVKYDSTKYNIEVTLYGSINSASLNLNSTKTYEDGENVTVQEGDRVSVIDVETDEDADGISVNGTAWSDDVTTALIKLNDAGDAVCWYDVLHKKAYAAVDGVFEITPTAAAN